MNIHPVILQAFYVTVTDSLRDVTMNGGARGRSTISSGFTLIELLVVMGIVSALVAIAVPQYTAYKSRAYDVRAEMDLRSVALAEEAYFLDAERYLSCTNGACTVLPGIRRLSSGVELTVTATSTGFIGKALHPKGSGRTFTWRSDGGGIEG